jgi:tetratricopeptide (TPR) repeat protein
MMDEADALDPREVAEGLVAEAQELGADGRWEEARTMLLEAIEERGEDPLLLCWSGIASQRLGEDGAAYELFRRTLAQNPDDPFVLAAAGSGVAGFDDPDAEPALRAAAVTAPDFAFARASYGAYLAREGLFAQAIEELEAAFRLAPDDADVGLDLAVARLQAGERDRGIASLEEVLGLRGDDSWTRALLGLAQAEAGQGEEAAEVLHQASMERPEDVEIQLVAALAAAAQGWLEEAERALASAEAAAESLDSDLIEEVQHAIDNGDEAAEALLRDELAPSVMRERLAQRG